MAGTVVNTTRFGDIQVEEERIITFVEPIFGFEKSLRYVILDHAENSPFKWLQSIEDPELAFVVTNPVFFGLEYEFELPDETVNKLALSAAEDALVLTIVNIPASDPSKMTANLLGPIIIHQGNRKAMQVVLNESRFSTKTRLIPDEAAKKGGVSSQGASSEKGE